MKAKEKSDIKAVIASNEELIEMARKQTLCFDAQNLGSVSRVVARMKVNEMGKMEVLERYDE